MQLHPIIIKVTINELYLWPRATATAMRNHPQFAKLATGAFPCKEKKKQQQNKKHREISQETQSPVTYLQWVCKRNLVIKPWLSFQLPTRNTTEVHLCQTIMSNQ